MREVLLIASPEDDVARRLAEELGAKGCRVLPVDGPTAARRVTVRRGPSGATVVPTLPMFMRPSAWWRPPGAETDDELFLRGEAWAALWAAGALTPAPVINRPTEEGCYGRPWGVASRDEAAAGLSPRREVFASRAKAMRSVDGLWAEDLMDYATGPLEEVASESPLRARPVDPSALYEIVSVVGRRGFAATLDARSREQDLVTQSVRIAGSLGLAFATVTWSIGADERPVVARINPSPLGAELRYAWAEVADALCEELLA